MKKTIISLIFTCVALNVLAGTTQEHRFAQKAIPQDLNIFQSHTAAYFSGRSVYSILGLKVCTVGGNVKDIEINPTGASVAVVWQSGKGTKLSIYDMYKQDVKIAKPKFGYNPQVVTYSSDGKLMFVCDGDGKVHTLDSRTFAQTEVIELGFMPSKMISSPNGDFLAVAKGDTLQVRIAKGGALRKEINLGMHVNDFAFSPDNSFICVLFDGGVFMEYDTATFLPGEEVNSLGISRAIAVHKDSKYVAIVTADSVLAIVNRMDTGDREYMNDGEGAVNCPAFPSKSPQLVAYSTANSIVYRRLPMILPNYHKLISEEVEKRMEEWIKQMPGESLEAYAERVNEDTRARQMALFEEEIATKMAEGQLEAAQVSLGSYNAEEGLLSLTFDSMPSIFLSVPASKLGSFSNVEDLEFNNPRYGVTKEDKFELVYVEVRNKRTGASFVFDNRERKSLDYLRTSDSFVPLSIMQLSNMEELMLEEIKDNVVKNAKDRNTISNHTHINVSTGVEKGVDATGARILNYKVTFDYDVEKEFSSREDFAPGKYHVEESYAAQAMTQIIKAAFDGDFAQYVKAGKRIKVSITGMADNLKIGRTIPYDGAYGSFESEPVYGESLFAITVTPQSGISSNEQLAFVRAAGVKQHIQQNVPVLSTANVDYEYHIVLSDEEGGAHRRISVIFTFYDAF